MQPLIVLSRTPYHTLVFWRRGFVVHRVDSAESFLHCVLIERGGGGGAWFFQHCAEKQIQDTEGRELRPAETMRGARHQLRKRSPGDAAISVDMRILPCAYNHAYTTCSP